MSWNYSGDPSKSPLDELRFTIGDTDKSEQLLLDGELNFLISKSNGSIPGAAIRACEMVMAKYARLADESVGQVKISYSQKAKAYREMRDDLRQRQAIDDCVPYAGGISNADKQGNQGNSDRVAPAFTKDMFDSPASANPQQERSDSGEGSSGG